MPLHVAVLWHMHQPYYFDPVRGTALMPWVRLHATKGYLDMAWLVEQVPGFRCTFNLTPVLLRQIEQLAAGTIRDTWHDLAATPADALTAEQKALVLEHFFKANWENMVRPFPRYWTLLQKRGARVAPGGYGRIAASFSVQEFRDLQAWFNLAWFGYAADRLYPEIAALKTKGQNFTEEDKQTIFAAQLDVLQNVLKCYRALAEKGQIEISTTPFYHPILPLVLNTEHARRCMPSAQLPPKFSQPDDVRAQLVMARELHEKTFGAPPVGLWPSEGSVCPELIPILEELGFEWFATDEEILWRSLATFEPGRVFDRNVLFQGHRVAFGESSISAAFRDRTLSDFVGFSASRNDPQRAADFMLQHLEGIARVSRDGDRLCAVVLDGENAWEHFSDGGEIFLRTFYERLANHPELRTTTFRDYFSSHTLASVVPTLHTGSWINGNFSIWIGHPEDNRGWDLLGRTRAFLQGKINRGELSLDQQRLAMDEIFAAEGSDWFWWYGDDFVTDNDLIFDELFRTHLQNVYNICGAPIPEILKTHICRSEAVHAARQPTELIHPQIDGLVTSFYEWTGAGIYEAGRNMGAMFRAERLVESIHFGFDMEQLYLRIDFRKEATLPAKTTLRINFTHPTACSIIVEELQQGDGKAEFQSEGGGNSEIDFRFDKVIEIGVPFQKLAAQSRDQIQFFIQILSGGIEQERHPEVGTLSATVPDELFEVENWRV